MQENGTLPVPGYYYGYKRNPSDPTLNSCAYFVIGVFCHPDNTPENPRPKVVVYFSLYGSDNSRLWYRTVDEFLETRLKDGKQVDRYSRITDPATTQNLRRIFLKMYTRTPELLAIMAAAAP